MKVVKRMTVALFCGWLLGFTACQPEVVSPVSEPADPPFTLTPADPAVPPSDPPPPTTPATNGPATNGPETTTPTPVAPAPPPAPKLSLAPLLKSDRVYFRTPDGGKQFQFKPKDVDSVKFYDAAGTELCKLTMSSDKLKAKTADDRPLFELKWHGDKVAFKDGTTDKELSKLRFHGADFEFVVGEATQAKIIHQAGGNYVVQNAAGEKVGDLTSEEGHAVWKPANGSQTLVCNETSNSRALIGLALPGLTPPQQAALLVYFVSRLEN